jgi:MYXO-CTERM domain-containing protein
MAKSFWGAACPLAAAVVVLCQVVGCGSAPSQEQAESVQEAVVTATGVDYSFARPSPSGLHAEGYTFACRYLSPPPNSKNLSQSEAQQLWAAGVDIVANFEEGATNALNGQSQGVTDANVADSQSQADGIPTGRPIYFSVDFDAQSTDFAAIDAYFDGVASVIGVGRTGAYGGYAVIQHLFDVGKIRWGWQTYAWSNGAWDSRAQLRQVQNDITAAGDSACCDEDQAWAADFGQWHASSSDPCASAADGYYCGQSTQWAGGTKDHLYDCVGGVTKSNVDCPGGCIVEPSGKPDQCAPYDGGAGVSADGSADGAAGSAADAAPGSAKDAGTGAPPSVDGGGSSPGNPGPNASEGGTGDAPTEAHAGCSVEGAPTAGSGWAGAWLAIAWLVRRRRAASVTSCRAPRACCPERGPSP